MMGPTNGRPVYNPKVGLSDAVPLNEPNEFDFGTASGFKAAAIATDMLLELGASPDKKPKLGVYLFKRPTSMLSSPL